MTPCGGGTSLAGPRIELNQSMLPIKSTVPVRYPPVATWSLIAINCVVFLFETSLSEAQLEEFLSQFALVPAHFSDPAGVTDYLSSFSNMFLTEAGCI